jgi:hypothetical protein
MPSCNVIKMQYSLKLTLDLKMIYVVEHLMHTNNNRINHSNSNKMMWLCVSITVITSNKK